MNSALFRPRSSAYCALVFVAWVAFKVIFMPVMDK